MLEDAIALRAVAKWYERIPWGVLSLLLSIVLSLILYIWRAEITKIERIEADINAQTTINHQQTVEIQIILAQMRSTQSDLAETNKLLRELLAKQR